MNDQSIKPRRKEVQRPTEMRPHAVQARRKRASMRRRHDRVRLVEFRFNRWYLLDRDCFCVSVTSEDSRTDRQTFPDEHERRKMREKSDAILLLKDKLEERNNNLCQPYSIKRYPVTLQDSARISFMQLHAIRMVIIFPSLAPFFLRNYVPKENTCNSYWIYVAFACIHLFGTLVLGSVPVPSEFSSSKNLIESKEIFWLSRS
jgi:hypothetical protein